MNGDQIFLSHSSEDNEFACRLYEYLQSARYWVWMDKYNIRAGAKWEPQIDDNLRKSKTFLFLMSSPAAESEWVRHEGSMALALNRKMITVRFKPHERYGDYKLPLWAKPIQPISLFEGAADYEDQLEKLKRLLGKPLPIQQYLLSVLPHYKATGFLLDEASLDLIERHYDELHLTSAERKLADALIRDTHLRLDDYWTRYQKVKDYYDKARTENIKLKLENNTQRSEISLRHFLLIIYVVAILFLEVWIIYNFFKIWLQFGI